MEYLELSGNEYRINKLQVMTQIAVARRVAPVFAPLAPLLRELRAASTEAAEPAEGEQKRAPDVSPRLISAVTEEFNKLKDSDVTFVISAALSATQRKSGQSWAQVWNSAAQQPQFEDMTMMDVLSITFHCILHSIGNFSPASLQNSSAPGMPT